MTFKALMSLGAQSPDLQPLPPIIDRYHGGGGGHGWHGHKKGGNSGAALSALTLLAFLFLMNVMQQSLQENNTTETTTTQTIFLREDQQPVPLKSRQDESVMEKMEPENTTKLPSFAIEKEKERKKETMYIKIRKPTV